MNTMAMEKRTPHYKLADILAIVSTRGMAAFTATALFNGAAMGLSPEQILAVVLGLQRAKFYKSMTTHANHTVWQDVYHAPTPLGRTAYIKVTLQAGAVVIQFKEQ